MSRHFTRQTLLGKYALETHGLLGLCVIKLSDFMVVIHNPCYFQKKSLQLEGLCPKTKTVLYETPIQIKCLALPYPKKKKKKKERSAPDSKKRKK